jgi:Fe-S cluster biogenesis protein NfuA
MPTNLNDIKITAEPQMDPNVCRFVADRPLYGGVANCTGKETAAGSPLLEKLFALDAIREVMVSGATVTVAKTGDEDWSVLGKKIGVAIREAILAGGDLIDPDFRKQQPTNEELRAKVQKVFDEDINPGLSMHGGGVELVDIQGTTIFVTLSGGCHGCASAKYTLKHGIEQILRAAVPEVTEVVDVTDHGSGENPYY